MYDLRNNVRKIRGLASKLAKAMARFGYLSSHVCNVFCNAYDILNKIQQPLIQTQKDFKALKINNTIDNTLFRIHGAHRAHGTPTVTTKG